MKKAVHFAIRATFRLCYTVVNVFYSLRAVLTPELFYKIRGNIKKTFGIRLQMKYTHLRTFKQQLT